MVMVLGGWLQCGSEKKYMGREFHIWIWQVLIKGEEKTVSGNCADLFGQGG